ncbi:unnamed protein product, partial [marine sediment metagenome]
MAAILPHLETVNDPSYTNAERENFRDIKPRVVRGVAGLGALAAPRSGAGTADVSSLQQDVLNNAHAQLVDMAWVRRAAELQMLGKPFRIQVGDAEGANKREIFIVFDEPMGQVPIWNPPGEGKVKQFKLLSWTSKMGTPSFSLPAGTPGQGGACPGATGGQSIVPISKLRPAAESVSRIIKRPVVLDQAICEYCYAEGGRYGSGQLQYGQVARFIWTRHATRTEEATFTEFVPVMDWAVKNANYLLEGGPVGSGKDKKTYLPERLLLRDMPPGYEHLNGTRAKFFRLHDSGDAYSENYIRGWKRVADLNPDVIFWAPSRMWALNNGRAWINKHNRVPANLVMRPSAYMIDTPPPPLPGNNPGWAAGTVVWTDIAKPKGGPMLSGKGTPYDWDCQTYLVEKKEEKGAETKSCRNALAPDGKIGCRACWVHGSAAPQLVNIRSR